MTDNPGRHTPGPWRVSKAKPTRTRGFDILAGYSMRVASAALSAVPMGFSLYDAQAEREANARHSRCLGQGRATHRLCLQGTSGGAGMNKILFWVAFAVPSVGLAPNVDSMKNVIFVLIGLAIGLWVYPRLGGRG